MRHVGPLRSVALSCNIKITYVATKMLKNRLGVHAIILLDTFIYFFLSLYVLISVLGDFLKYVTRAEVCY